MPECSAARGILDDAQAARDLDTAGPRKVSVIASATNHFSISEGNDADHKLVAADIKVSTLVIRGTSDPLFPIAHGEALASAVKGATLVRIEGGGHELHEADWPGDHRGDRQAYRRSIGLDSASLRLPRMTKEERAATTRHP